MGASESREYSAKEQYPEIPNVYYPRSNGGIPFRVRLEKGIAYIDKDKRWDEKDYEDYEKFWKQMPKWELILETSYNKVFTGKEDPNYPPPCPSDIGSSVLLQVSSDKYIYVGIFIHELEIKEQVKDFISYSGCRDTVESYIYTEKDVINPLDGMKFPIKILKGKQPYEMSGDDFGKYKNNKVKIVVLHDFVG